MIKNIVEDVVAREYEQLKSTIAGFEDSETMKDDVMAYALNRLPPRYVARRTGQIVTNLSMQSDQEMARVSVVLLEAFRVVRSGANDTDVAAETS